MNNSRCTPDDSERTVRELDSFRNDILGVAAFGFGLTALQFTPAQAPAIATIAEVFLVIWALVKVLPRYREHAQYYAQLGHITSAWVAFKRNIVLTIGFTFLGLIAAGWLTIDDLQSLSLAHLTS